MASAELMKITYGVDDRVKRVEGNVQVVHGDVVDVSNKVEGVDNRLQGIGSDVKDMVQGVDDKLEQANRSSSLLHLLIVPGAQISPQGTSSGTVFYDGFRPQIHPSITTLHPKLITSVQLSGSFKVIYSASGSPLSRSCGFTENVCYLWPSHATTPDQLLFL